MTLQQQVDAYQEDLQLFATPDEKMEYVLDLAALLPPFPDEKKTDENLIRGCSSRAWLLKSYENGIIRFQTDGESAIAKGMLALMGTIFSDRTPDEILAFDPAGLKALGFDTLLTPVRQKSLEALIGAIYGYAQRCKETAHAC